MSMSGRREPISCECRRGCPPYTWPLGAYFLTVQDVLGVPLDYLNRLMRFDRFDDNPQACFWKPVVPDPRFDLEQLTHRRLTNCGPIEDGWQFVFALVEPNRPIRQWTLDVCWFTPGPIPIDPNSRISCSQVRLELPQTSGGIDTICLMEAAYPNACDHDDYPARVQSPWHHLTPR